MSIRVVNHLSPKIWTMPISNVWVVHKMAFAARSQSRSGGVGVETWTPCTGVQYSVQCTVYSAQNRFCAQQKLSADGGGSPAPGLGPTGGLALHSGSPGTRGGDELSGAISTWNHLHSNNLQRFSQIYIHIHAQIWAAHTMNMAWKDLNPFKKPDMTAAGSSFLFDLTLRFDLDKSQNKCLPLHWRRFYLCLLVLFQCSIR